MPTKFGSSYSCETLFSFMNYIKATTRNIGMDMSAACVKLKATKCEPRIETLATKMQQDFFIKTIGKYMSDPCF